MGTRGYYAYRFKGKYYRMYVHCDTYPRGLGSGMAGEIPQDPETLKQYIENITTKLQNKKERKKLFGWEEHDVCTGSNWTLGDTFIEWTYVIDFDHRVLTVNGAVHFPFDRMPPVRGSESEPGFVEYLESYERIEIPAKYLTTIDLWPESRFDVDQAQQQYNEIQPTIIALHEWGAATWESLSVSHHLSTCVVKALMSDHSDELSLAHYSNVWHKLGLFCWQVANAAAPAHLVCPPLDAVPQQNVLYVRTDLVQRPSYKASSQPVQMHMGGVGTLGRYCWFRGCLITFCPRLDQPAYMMHQVNAMVENLRKHDRTSGVGIVMSGWHIVAVAIDGSEVRHSPVMELHDGKELKGGMLLLMHLLSPAFVTSKTPWRAEPPIEQPHNTSSLPDDVLRQIIHFTDLDTYLTLRLVSRYIRSICLAHPRIGDYILLSHKANPTSDGMFKVRSTSSTSASVATLMRTKTSVDKPTPIWRFRSKHYSKCVLNPGLAGTFQYHQSGNGPFTPRAEEENGGKAPVLMMGRVAFRDMIKGDKHHDMRIQLVDGIWEMAFGEAPAPEVQEESQTSWGSRLYERMSGFDSEDLDGMSEAEKTCYLSDPDECNDAGDAD